MERRVIIQWTETARKGLKQLPCKARAGIIAKADELAACKHPKSAHKPLQGPLQGYCRIAYGRSRAIHTVAEEELADNDVVIHVRILFVAEGIRKEHDKKDVYKVAKKLVDLGLLNLGGSKLGEDEDTA